MNGGNVQSRNIPSSKYKPGRLNSRRNRGTRRSTIMIEISSSALVYLHKKPIPTSRPVAGQCQENSGLRSKAHQKVNIAAVQKRIERGSIVMTKLPMFKIGVALRASTSHSPAIALKRRRAK